MIHFDISIICPHMSATILRHSDPKEHQRTASHGILGCTFFWAFFPGLPLDILVLENVSWWTIGTKKCKIPVVRSSKPAFLQWNLHLNITNLHFPRPKCPKAYWVILVCLGCPRLMYVNVIYHNISYYVSYYIILYHIVSYYIIAYSGTPKREGGGKM